MGGAGLQFEPQPAASQWGDLLPKRLEPGDEAILVHERTQMKGFLNGVMRDHGVEQTLLLAVITMGNGEEISTNTPLVVRADMTETEFAKFEPNFTKEVQDEPVDAFLDVSRKRWMPWQAEAEANSDRAQLRRGLARAPRLLENDRIPGKARAKGQFPLLPHWVYEQLPWSEADPVARPLPPSTLLVWSGRGKPWRAWVSGDSCRWAGCRTRRCRGRRCRGRRCRGRWGSGARSRFCSASRSFRRKGGDDHRVCCRHGGHPRR
jgi:hypothetical protein